MIEADEDHQHLTKHRRPRIQYGGEITAAAISQNSFVDRSQTTAFSKEAVAWNECMFRQQRMPRRDPSSDS
jgi:hypothetical protein